MRCKVYRKRYTFQSVYFLNGVEKIKKKNNNFAFHKIMKQKSRTEAIQEITNENKNN